MLKIIQWILLFLSPFNAFYQLISQYLYQFHWILVHFKKLKIFVEEYEKEYIYVYVCVCVCMHIYIYIKLSHFEITRNWHNIENQVFSVFYKSWTFFWFNRKEVFMEDECLSALPDARWSVSNVFEVKISIAHV